MTKFIKDKDGKFAGSIGDGKTAAPTTPTAAPVARAEHRTLPPITVTALEKSLALHFSTNHYPKVHPVFIPIAVEAITKAKAGQWDDEIEYPNGYTRSVAYTVEGLHLENFLDD